MEHTVQSRRFGCFRPSSAQHNFEIANCVEYTKLSVIARIFSLKIIIGNLHVLIPWAGKILAKDEDYWRSNKYTRSIGPVFAKFSYILCM